MNKHIIKSVFFGFILLFSTSCSNDDNANNTIPTIAFSKTFGGSQEDYAYSVIETQDGNLAVFGYTGSIDGDITDKTVQENDYWLIKLDMQGNILWSKTYGGSGDDKGQKLIQTTDGGFAIVGYSMSSDGDGSNNEGFHDNWILKLDNSGNILWEKSFGFSGHDHAYSVTQTNDGGFLMTGFLDVTASGGLGNSSRAFSSRLENTQHGVGEFWCHKLDANGNIEWRKYFGGTNNDRSFDVVQANDGGYVIVGFSESNDFDITNSRGSYDYWVIKIDASGTLVWQKSFGGSGVDQARSIVKTSDNAYIIAGNSFSSDSDISNNLGDSDFWLVKLNDDGNEIWSNNYGGSNFDYASSINKTTNGYVVSGYSQSNSGHLNSNYGSNDFWVITINEQGSLLSQKNLGGSGLDLAHDAIQTSTGNIIVIGETESNDIDITENKGLKDILVVKLNE